MLAAPLLRTRTTKNGFIVPLFCTRQEEIDLAERLIQEFETSWKKREKRSELDSRIYEIESKYNTEYKLVRGLCALIERRCTFGNEATVQEAGREEEESKDLDNDNSWRNTNDDDNNNNDYDNAKSASDINRNKDDEYDNNNNIIFYSDPATIRRALFEESSKRGFALTDLERKEIIDTVASRLGLSAKAISNTMWSDLEDNQVINQFDKIDAKSLIGWYNLSLIQTLLFNCTKLDFSVMGGLNWKHVLRDVKRLGLMYQLQQQEEEIEGAYGDDDSSSSNTNNNIRNKKIVCSLEGPISLFKLTDRYGTSLAKLIPSIVIPRNHNNNNSNEDGWNIHAWILKRTLDGKRMLYEFKLSDSEAPKLLVDPFFNKFQDVKRRGEPILSSPPRSTLLPPPSSSSFDYFDSAVEQKFARRFDAAASSTGWKLVREPDPLIVSGGRAFIPDFMFEKYGKRVYLEIVGFWTPEYLERKLKKLTDIIIGGNNNKNNGTKRTTTPPGNSPTKPLGSMVTTSSSSSEPAFDFVDLFIALNKDLACSNTMLSSLSLHVIPKERLILYEKDLVPIKPILDHLKSIDKSTMEKNLGDRNLKAELDPTKDIISVEEITINFQMPARSAIANANGDDDKKSSSKAGPFLPPDIAMKIAMRDYGDKYIDIAGTHLISKAKADRLRSLLANTSKFTDACTVLAQNGIPESCHAELISKLGYDVVWQSMDPSSAIIVRREKEHKKSSAA